MSGFLYFQTGLDKPVTVDDLAGLGLTHAFDETPQSSPIHGRTPSGSAGMLIWSQARMGPWVAAYQPEKQDWEPVDGAEGLFVGCYKDARPTPETLARPELVRGEAVRFADGHDWRIPRLAVFAGDGGFQVVLPMLVKRAGGQWMTSGVVPKYRFLGAIYDRLLAYLVNGGALDVRDALDATVELASANYYVGATELGLVGALSGEESVLHGVISAAMDWATALEWAQKKTPESSPAASGG